VKPGRRPSLLHGKPLTSTELKCLLAASHGMRAEETAELLGMSWATLKTHMQNTRRKLAAKNTAHAIAIATREGLIS
jgi:DNA-binding CsgD family transcriptional regulator